MCFRAHNELLGAIQVLLNAMGGGEGMCVNFPRKKLYECERFNVIWLITLALRGGG